MVYHLEWVFTCSLRPDRRYIDGANCLTLLHACTLSSSGITTPLTVALKNSFSNQVSDPTGFNKIITSSYTENAWNRVRPNLIWQVREFCIGWVQHNYGACVLYTVSVLTSCISMISVRRQTALWSSFQWGLHWWRAWLLLLKQNLLLLN